MSFRPDATSSARQRVPEILRRLAQAYPDARCSLDFTNPLELLVATILSAQCTDERVNLVTKELFRKYRTPQDYLSVPAEELEQDIRSTGFYRNKAKAIRGACHALLERFDGQVPRTMEELLSLPGVARKTANVVLGNAYGVVEGVVVDTHVARVSKRLGLTVHNDPAKIERDLMALVPREEWLSLSHRLIAHGRAVCEARRPRCGECPLAEVCPSAGAGLPQGTAAVVRALAARGVRAEVRAFEGSTRTAEEAAAAIGTSVGRIVKSLVFLADEEPVLVLASGANRVDTARLGAALGRTVRRAEPERVQRETGFAVGGVPPVGHRRPLATYVDADLMQFDEVWAAAGTANSVFPISPRRLVEVTGGVVLDLKCER